MNKVSDAVKHKNILTALLILKREVSTSTFSKFSMIKLITDHGIAHPFSQAILKLGVVEGGKEAGGWKWVYGIEPLTIELATKVLDEMRKHQNNQKSKFPRVKKPKVEQPQKLELKEEVKHLLKPGKPSIDEKLKEFKLKGTIFGYKQLKFMKNKFFPKAVEVVLDSYLNFKHVQMITFDIDADNKSRLIINFYMYADKFIADGSSLIASLAVDNTVLAMCHIEGEKHELKIYTIQVNDPYNLKEL